MAVTHAEQSERIQQFKDDETAISELSSSVARSQASLRAPTSLGEEAQSNSESDGADPDPAAFVAPPVHEAPLTEHGKDSEPTDLAGDWDVLEGASDESGDSEESLKAVLTSAGLEAFFDPLCIFTLDELVNKSEDELEDIADDAGMKKDARRKFIQVIQNCIQDLFEDLSPALVELLSRKGLEKYARALSVLDVDTVEMLLGQTDVKLVEICSDAGFSKGDREKLCELVQEENDKKSIEPSLGGELFQTLQHKAHCVPNFEGTSLTVMYMPFRQPASFDHTYQYNFPAGTTPNSHSCKLVVLDADVPEQFIDRSVQKELYILVIGATGAGKSTQIDSMLNYIVGVKRCESFRLKLVDESSSVANACLHAGQAASQTDAVTAYRLPAFRGATVKAKVTIIDTPGFGDTRGLHFDRKIVDQLTKFFKDCEGVSQHVAGLTGVCFVTQASLPRLTESQEYVWSSILGLFGKDISDNILMCFTFADGKKPQTLAAVQKSNIPMAEHFKFNNSALFACPEEKNDTLSKMFWDMGKGNMEKFFARLQQMQTKSLRLTRQVLDERERLEVSLENLQPAIQKMLNAAETLRTESKLIESLSQEQLAAKDFQYETKVSNFRKIPLTGNTNTTTCLECNATCHRDCVFANDSDKRKCCAMDGSGNCTQCSRKCRWDQHRNLPYILEWFEEKKTITSEDLKKKYDAATKGKLDKEKLLEGIKSELEQFECFTVHLVCKLKHCKERLYKIAMRPNAMPSEKYLDMMINNERNAQQPGFEARVAALNALKQKTKLWAEATSEGYDPMQAYVRDPTFTKFYQPKARAKVLRQKKTLAAQFSQGVSNMASGITNAMWG